MLVRKRIQRYRSLEFVGVDELEDDTMDWAVVKDLAELDDYGKENPYLILG